MQTVFHSAFLQALGFAIASSLWQMALVWLAFSALNLISKPNAANKYRMATVAQFAGFTWFIVTLQFYYAQCNEAFQNNPSLHQTGYVAVYVPANGHPFQAALLQYLVKAEALLPFLSSAYILLLIILFIKWTGNYFNTQALRTKGLQKIDADWKIFVKNVTAQLGIKQEVNIYISELINTPLTIGFLKPVILVPLASINCLTVPQLEAVLLHELAHIKRYDYLLNIILSVIEITLFFNPFTQLISRQVNRERENSCDDWVLQFQYHPAIYAEALLQIAYLSNQTITPSLSMAAAKKNGDLLSRVKRMIGSNDSRFNYRNQLLSLIMITAILSAIAWFHPISNKNIPAANINKTVAAEPMAAKIDNPLFNPVFFMQKPFKQQIENNLKPAAKQETIPGEVVGNSKEILQTIAPFALKEIQPPGYGKIRQVVDESLENITFGKPGSVNIQMDTVEMKKGLQPVWGQDFKKQWARIGEEIKKAKKQIEKTFTNQPGPGFAGVTMQEEITRAFAEIKKINIPLIHAGKVLESMADMEHEINMNLQKEKIKLRQQKKIAGLVHEIVRKIAPNTTITPVVKQPEIQYNTEEAFITAPSLPAKMAIKDIEVVTPWEMNQFLIHPAVYISSGEEPKRNNYHKAIIIKQKKFSTGTSEKQIEIIIPNKNNEEGKELKIIVEVNNN